LYGPDDKKDPTKGADDSLIPQHRNVELQVSMVGCRDLIDRKGASPSLSGMQYVEYGALVPFCDTELLA
jgi:hypothetical protein